MRDGVVASSHIAWFVRVARLSGPLGASTTRMYTQLDQVASSTDALARTITISDHTRADGAVVEHGVVFNARGQLLSRTRGGQGLVWEYDKDGYRVAFTDANGITTTYERDAAGRVTAVANPRLGRAIFAYNEAGQLASSRVGEGIGALVQEWAYRGGALSERTRTPDGDTTAQLLLWVDGLGELASENGENTWWDTGLFVYRAAVCCGLG